MLNKLQPIPQVKRNKKIKLGMFDIFMYFADLNDSYFILQVNLAAAMEEEEDVSYMFFFFPTRFILQTQA